MRLTAVIIAVILTCIAHAAYAHETPSCQNLNYNEADYTVCKFNPMQTDIRLFLKRNDGSILGSFDAVNKELAKNGEQLLFAMNAGMYHKDRSPVGLYRQDGQSAGRLQTKASSGNFGMLPNGVFHVHHDKVADISETVRYMLKSVVPDAATQSGPMLVINGELHPKFKAGSSSRKIRNGVGRTRAGKIVFVKSDAPVNFYDFASLFKDELKAFNALYLDGVVSRLYSAELNRNDFGRRMGPIVGVVVPKVQAQARYIANEGVIVSHGESKIMFDPLPLSGFGVYPEPGFADIAKMMAGQGEYAGMDAVFISHAHRDHFSATKMIAYMNAQPDVWLVAPQQALDMMTEDKNWEADLRLRMRIVDMEAGDAPEAIEIGDIKATAVRIPHSGWPARASVQIMVYRVTLDEGATVMHMGDADTRRQHFIPHKDHWQAMRTDTAFPPYWFLTSANGRYILEEEMNVAKSIGVHVPIEVPKDLKDSGVDYFSKNGEIREIGE
jgi:uncharacterized protein YigE (DUF2233 family)/L-ascorbate metabolism protein UlaG (beta-lactamase superfamily)